jgi:DNA mismatch repair ATPase MutS
MRLGDFYEVFGENAAMLASELDLTLTGRDCGLESRVPMIGFPYHCAEMYFKKINAKHDLVIVESDDDSETRYLPRIKEKQHSLPAIDNGIMLKLKDIFGNDLEVK